MICTSEEATKKFCPYSEWSEGRGVAFCEANGCMAWRWVVETIKDNRPTITDFGFCGRVANGDQDAIPS